MLPWACGLAARASCPGVATLGRLIRPGVPPATVQDTLVARFNDLDSVTALFEQFRGEIAAVIVEPRLAQAAAHSQHF